MKIVNRIVVITFVIGSFVFARTGKSNIKVEKKNIQEKTEHYWVKDFSDNSTDNLDRKRSHKRRRKIRKPNKGLR